MANAFNLKNVAGSISAHAKILDVGCGKNKRGNVGIDFDRHGDADIIGDVHHLPFKANIFDMAICSHILEHSANYKEILKKVNKILKTDGVIAVTFPNFRSWQTLKYWLKDEVNEPLFHYKNELDHHRVCFTCSKMKEALKDAGFEPFKVEGGFRHFQTFFQLFFSTRSQNVTILARKR